MKLGRRKRKDPQEVLCNGMLEMSKLWTNSLFEPYFKQPGKHTRRKIKRGWIEPRNTGKGTSVVWSRCKD